MPKGIDTPFTNAIQPKSDFHECDKNGSDPTEKPADTDKHFGGVAPKDLPFNTLQFDRYKK